MIKGNAHEISGDRQSSGDFSGVAKKRVDKLEKEPSCIRTGTRESPCEFGRGLS